MDQLTRKLVADLDRRIGRLQQARKLLVDEGGEDELAQPAKPIRNRAVPNGNSRHIQVFEWLRSNGPATRKQILDGTGIPPGTIGSVFEHGELFVQGANGEWSAIEPTI